MRTREFGRVLSIACVLALVSLVLMVWSLLEPTPLPVLVAMSLGQVIGTISLLMFLAVVLADMRRAHLERIPRSTAPPPP